MSPSGIFKGYSYDTLGTRRGLEDPTIPLSVLGQYRHILWLSSTLVSQEWDQVHGVKPMTSLRYMSAPNRQSPLATWVQMGGNLWALGGAFGGGTNTGTIPVGWNNPANDSHVRTYSYVDPYKDLGPGRFMFDLTHWQSEFRTASGIMYKVARLDQPDPMTAFPPPKVDWTGEPLRDPRFAALPTLLKPKDPTSDPRWPNRASTNFYLNNPTYGSNGLDLEFLSYENRITEVEAENPSPNHREEFSTLDTLYLAYGLFPGVMLQPRNGEGVNACMTYYHGHDCGPVVFSGFDIWHWRRQDCVQLVDTVLQGLWGLSRSAQVSAAAIRPAGRAALRR
jgi:hypothetical protein